MSFGPFIPATFEQPVVSPVVTTLTRRVPYISPTEFADAPTAVATSSLVPGGDAAAQSAELYNVLLRASDWADLICFHGPDGTLAASPTTDAGWITPKAGNVSLQCNMRPILAVTGMAFGVSPSQLQNIDPSIIGDISMDGTIIQVVNPYWYGIAPFSSTTLTPPPRRNGKVYAAWTYISGFPHCLLAEDAEADATSIIVDSAVPGGAAPYGVFPGTQLTIVDSGGVEDVIVASVAGSTLELASPTQFAHTVPAYPDFVPVSAIPHSVHQAVISLASCLIKIRGTKSLVMPSAPGAKMPTKTDMGQAGGLDDFDTARGLLKPFTTVYRRNSSA